jgi:hypothetical protein
MTTLRKDIVADLAKFFARDEDKTAPVAPVGPMTELIRGGEMSPMRSPVALALT